ncbi:class I SAM-dependent methyltransferase [Inhella gelatinilytica]|uniref:Methyltransferase domain-containing protein n=1 Tax=Inhella gelatinilytica TaxID=2795030 RepID=A0A931NCZ5_9BURK|nr:class I SAM-dependent methyltransferase [Inhella gelatinilytica]MBH9551720.1 methyltransferase domain-containing protein [Inhella gelatinilytica]
MGRGIQVDRAAVWSRYWATGAQHSCAGSFGARYDGAFERFWRAALESVSGERRVLDLCTGSGAIPRLIAAVWADDGPWHVDGVDLADVPSVAELALPEARIRLWPRTSITQLPFATASMDLITSQYGVEYGDWAQTLPEVFRVLKPQGQVCWALHAQPARPVQLARSELMHQDALLAPDGLLACAERMLPLLARAQTAKGRAQLDRDPAALNTRDLFNAAQEALAAALASSSCPDVVHEARAVVNQALQTGSAAALVKFRTQVLDAQLRLRELCEAAVSDETLRNLEHAFVDRGFEVRLTPIQERGHLMALGFQARGPGGVV